MAVHPRKVIIQAVCPQTGAELQVVQARPPALLDLGLHVRGFGAGGHYQGFYGLPLLSFSPGDPPGSVPRGRAWSAGLLPGMLHAPQAYGNENTTDLSMPRTEDRYRVRLAHRSRLLDLKFEPGTS